MAVNISHISKGIQAFIIGILISTVAYYVVPPLINALLSGLENWIMWFGLIIFWLLMIIVRPLMILRGMTD